MGTIPLSANLSYTGSDFVSLYTASLFSPFDASFILKAGDEEKIALALMGSPDRLSATASISSLPLDRFVSTNREVLLDLTALGYTDRKTQLGLDGTLSLTEGDAPLFPIQCRSTTAEVFLIKLKTA